MWGEVCPVGRVVPHGQDPAVATADTGQSNPGVELQDWEFGEVSALGIHQIYLI